MEQPETVQLARKHRLLLVTVALGILLNPLNSSMIAVALARLQQDFHLTFADASWLISTYYLASAIGQPVMGKISDLWGRKRMFLIGLILIAISSALAPFSPSFWWLIAFRMIQAVGSSTLFPSGMGIVRKVITEGQARALAILSVFSSTSAAFGPSIGGFLMHYGDWHALFIINFPFVIASFVLALKVLPADVLDKTKKTSIDGVGVLLFSGAIVTWLLFLLSLETTLNLWLLGTAVLITVIFYKVETKKKEPFIDVKALKSNANMSLVYVQFILVNVVFYSIFFGVPTYLQQVKQYDSQLTGVIMLSVAGFGVLITPWVGRLIDKSGPRPGLILGSLSIISGTLLMLTIKDQSTATWIFIVLAILGLSNGFNNLGLQTALYLFVRPEETGAASGLFMTSRYVGTILSSSLLGIAFGHTVSSAQLHVIAWVAAVIGIIVLLLSWRIPSRKPASATS